MTTWSGRTAEGPERRTVWRALVWMALVAVLIYFRLPERFLSPFFFAEEGRVYFRFAWHNTVLDGLLRAHLGYYALWPNLSTTLAAHAVPLEYAPWVTTALGSSILVLVVLLPSLECSPVRGFVARLACVTLLLLVPVHYGKTHTSFAQHYLCFCTVMVLVSDARARHERWIHRATLAVAGASGASSLFVAPLFLWKYLTRGRPRELLLQMGILFASGVLQISVLLYTLAKRPDQVPSGRWAAFEPGVYAGGIVERALIAPLLGLDAMTSSGEWLHAALTAGASTGLFWFALIGALSGLALVLASILGPRGMRTPATRTLLVAFVLVTLISFVTAITNQEGTKSELLLRHERYYVAPCLIAATVWLLHATSGTLPRWRNAYRVLVVWMLLASGYSYVWQRPELFRTGPEWTREIALWREDPARPLHTWPLSEDWPEGWMFHLRPARRARQVR